MTKTQTVALLNLAADQIRTDIVEYEAMLECIPRKSEDPNDILALRVFSDLLQERRAMLARLDRLRLQTEAPEAA